MIKGYQKLLAWQKADELAKKVYAEALTFPKEEVFGLTSQLKRAVLSVPLNIVEGHSRNSKNDFHRFLAIALGSLAETDYLLGFAHDLGYLNKSQFQELDLLREAVGQLTWKLYLSQQ